MFSKTISNINIKRNRINFIPISEQKSNFQHWPKILSPQKFATCNVTCLLLFICSMNINLIYSRFSKLVRVLVNEPLEFSLLVLDKKQLSKQIK